MAEVAKVLPFADAQARQLRPELLNRVTGDARTIAVAKFRELADKLERGELDGARVQWRTECPEMIIVTIDANTVQLTTTTIEEG